MIAKNIFRTVFCILSVSLLVTSCAAPAQATATPTLVSATATSKPTRTPVPTLAPTATVEGILSIDTLVEPLKIWNEIPIFPEAISGKEMDDGTTYKVLINNSINVIASYYQKEMKKLGWTPQDPPLLNDPRHDHLSFTKQDKAVVFEIFVLPEKKFFYLVYIHIVQL